MTITLTLHSHRLSINLDFSFDFLNTFTWSLDRVINQFIMLISHFLIIFIVIDKVLLFEQVAQLFISELLTFNFSSLLHNF
ncbi:Uncharacterised protein [Mycobacteroides abscessus subsp. abscessus]|nr:Uncharacterised protein [Mycobacteroides abscessus subsp. abscessus]